MNKLVKTLKEYNQNKTKTLNHSESGPCLLKFFNFSRELKVCDEEEIKTTFQNAFNENPKLAVKCLLYLRDTKAGQKEKKIFRIALKWLATEYPDLIEMHFAEIFEYGRWDDLYVLEGTAVWSEVLNQLRIQLLEDEKHLEKNEPVSYLAKWFPSFDDYSKKDRELALRLAYALGMSENRYQKILKELRSQIVVMERRICFKRWHSRKREKNTSLKNTTIYPFKIIEKVLSESENNESFDGLWKALPDYLKDNKHNGLVVPDVSGSMSLRPLSIAVSMAIYVAERIQGEFNNHFIHFSEEPEFVKITGDNLYEKTHFITQTNWDMTINVSKLLEMILLRAKRSNLLQEAMPDTVYIITDMEFDEITTIEQERHEELTELYKKNGYKKPLLVFWNVNAKHDHFPLYFEEQGTIVISGSSPSLFRQLLSGELKHPLEFMKEAVFDDN